MTTNVDAARVAPRRRRGRTASAELSYDVTATTVVLGALASRDWRPMHHDHDFAVNRNGTQRHLPEHAEPGCVVRAVRHRLDRADGPARADEVPHEGLGVPRRHDGLDGRRRLGRDRRRRLRLGRRCSVTLSVDGDVEDRLLGARRAADDGRRQPLDPPRRRLAALTRAIGEAQSDGSRLHRRAGDAARDGARRRAAAYASLGRRARRSRTTRRATRRSCGSSSPSSTSSG